MWIKGIFPAFAALFLLGVQIAQAGPADPLASEMWDDIKAEFLGDGPVEFDDGLRVLSRDMIEEPHKVSLVAQIPEDYGAIQELVILVENNPIPRVARIRPNGPVNAVGMNIRLEMSTPVRVAALTDDGIWRVGSQHVTVIVSGGCSSPMPYANVALGDVKVKQFERVGGMSRVKVRINHPMHTGLAPDLNGDIIPEYYIETINIVDDAGNAIEMQTWAAMSADPVITLDLPGHRQNVRVEARDSKGLEFLGLEDAPAM